jgi:hypothetical protein
LAGHRPLLAVAVAALVLLGASLVAVRRPPARLWLALLLAQGALLLLSPSYFAHYGTFVAPALALLAGAGADVLLEAVARPRLAPVVGLVALAVLSVHVVTQPEGRPAPEEQAETELAGVRCVAADSAAALVAADVLTRDLRDGCPVVVDVTGLTYDEPRGDLVAGPTPYARRRDAAWQRTVTRYFDRSGAVLLDQWRHDGLDPQVLTALERRDVVLGRRHFEVLVPAG